MKLTSENIPCVKHVVFFVSLKCYLNHSSMNRPSISCVTSYTMSWLIQKPHFTISWFWQNRHVVRNQARSSRWLNLSRNSSDTIRVKFPLKTYNRNYKKKISDSEVISAIVNLSSKHSSFSQTTNFWNNASTHISQTAHILIGCASVMKYQMWATNGTEEFPMYEINNIANFSFPKFFSKKWNF